MSLLTLSCGTAQDQLPGFRPQAGFGAQSGEETELIGGTILAGASNPMASHLVLVEFSIDLKEGNSGYAAWVREPGLFKQRCVGVMVDNSTVLTAKHCVENYNPVGRVHQSGGWNPAYVRIAVPKLASDGSRFVDAATKRIAVKWVFLNKGTDLATMGLSAPLPGVTGIPLCTSKWVTDFSGEVTVTGFGLDKTRGDYNFLKGFVGKVTGTPVKYVSATSTESLHQVVPTQAGSCSETGDSGGGIFAREGTAQNVCLAGIAQAKIIGTSATGGCATTQVLRIHDHSSYVTSSKKM